MSKVLAFSGSNSSQSINAQLAAYTAKILGGKVIDLRDFEVPMYGIDLEKSNGIPSGITAIMEHIQAADVVVIATPEHNGLMPAFFKNILDWLSRTGVKYLEEKKVMVMSAAPGNGAAKGAAGAVEKIIKYAGANVVARFNLPRFAETFNSDNGIVDSELSAVYNEALDKLK